MNSGGERYYLAVPLGVLRRFVEENKKESDRYIQLFELVPQRIYSETELTEMLGELKPKSTVIVDGSCLPIHKEENGI